MTSPAYCRALVQRLRSSSSQAEAAAKLVALVRGNAAAAEAAAAAGAIPALLQLLKRSTAASSAAVRGQVAHALACLCIHEPARLRQLLQAGGVDALLPLLPAAEDAAHLAAGLLGSIAQHLPDVRQQLGAAALRPLLAAACTPGTEHVRGAALYAINNL